MSDPERAGTAGEQRGNMRPLFGLEAMSPSDHRFARGGKDTQLARGHSERKTPDSRDPRAEGGDATNRNSAVVRTPYRGKQYISGAVRRIEQGLAVVSPQRIPSENSSGEQIRLPPLPMAASGPSYVAHLGFVVCVLVPILAATVYYGFIASNQYEAEFRFTVKDTTSDKGVAPISSLLSFPGSGNSTDSYLVSDFLTSREAAEVLQKRINVTSLYARPEVDWWSRFNSSQPMEKFVLYWQKMVTAQYDQVTGISIAKVSAFTPKDALLIANSLVTLSEQLVNEIARRAQTDAVLFAQKEVDRAEARLKAIRAKMTEYRNRVGVIDPNASVAASNSTLIQTLRANQAQLETQLATLLRQNLDVNGPLITTLKNQIASTKEQIQNTEATVAAGRGGAALSTIMAEYEQLELERQFAQNMLTSTMQALDQARANAVSQHLYITPYVRPSLPQSAAYPRRILSIATVGLLALVFWMIGLLGMRSIRERFA